MGYGEGGGGPIKIKMSWKFCCGRTANNFPPKCHAETQLRANQDGLSFGKENVAENVVGSQAEHRAQPSVNKIHSHL